MFMVHLHGERVTCCTMFTQLSLLGLWPWAPLGWPVFFQADPGRTRAEKEHRQCSFMLFVWRFNSINVFLFVFQYALQSLQNASITVKYTIGSLGGFGLDLSPAQIGT